MDNGHSAEVVVLLRLLFSSTSLQFSSSSVFVVSLKLERLSCVRVVSLFVGPRFDFFAKGEM